MTKEQAIGCAERMGRYIGEHLIGTENRAERFSVSVFEDLIKNTFDFDLLFLYPGMNYLDNKDYHGHTDRLNKIRNYFPVNLKPDWTRDRLLYHNYIHNRMYYCFFHFAASWNYDESRYTYQNILS